MVYKGDNVVGALMSVPIFVGTFSVVTDFAVLEKIEDYRDKGMGDVIFGEPFLREVGVKARGFEGMITLYKGNDEVSEKHEKNGILHAYQKLKGFYKGVLNLGPDYIRNAKTEEWLTRGHIRPHERNIDKVGRMHNFWNSMLITEYLVKVSKRRAFWSLNEDILKITILKTNTPYPSRKIRCICACIHQRPRGIKLNTPYPEDHNAVLELWNQYNVLEDIKHGLYSKKSPIRHI
ncbi:hypothetical protein Tco_0810536 [Tanacetum coccineum]